MFVARRLAGLSALILDYGISGARTQFPNADRSAGSDRAARRKPVIAQRRSGQRLRPASRLRSLQHSRMMAAGAG
jgi:hypothetical protein